MNIILGILIPFAGTAAGAACVFFMKDRIQPLVQKMLLGFASGVMVAASVWVAADPCHGHGGGYGKICFCACGGRISAGNRISAADGSAGAPICTWITRAGGTEEQSEKDHHAGAGGDAPQHSGRNGGGRGVCGNAPGRRHDYGHRRVCPVHRNCHTELSGRRHYFHALEKRGAQPGKGVSVRSGIRDCGTPGAAVTVLLASYITPVLPYLLALQQGAMIYVVVEELIPSRRRENIPISAPSVRSGLCADDDPGRSLG